MGEIVLRPSQFNIVQSKPGKKSELLQNIVGPNNTNRGIDELSANLSKHLVGKTPALQIQILNQLQKQCLEKVRQYEYKTSTKKINRRAVYSNLELIIRQKLGDLKSSPDRVGQFFDASQFLKTKIALLEFPEITPVFVQTVFHDDSFGGWDRYVVLTDRENPNWQPDRGTDFGRYYSLSFEKKLKSILQDISELAIKNEQKIHLLDQMLAHFEDQKKEGNKPDVFIHNKLCDAFKDTIDAFKAVRVASSEIDVISYIDVSKTDYSKAVTLKPLLSELGRVYSEEHKRDRSDQRVHNAFKQTVDTLLFTSETNLTRLLKSTLKDSVSPGGIVDKHAYFLNCVRILKLNSSKPEHAALKVAVLYQMMSGSEFEGINLAKAFSEVGRRGLKTETGLAVENKDLLFPLELLGHYLNENQFFRINIDGVPAHNYVGVKRFLLQLASFSSVNLVVRTQEHSRIYEEHTQIMGCFSTHKLITGQLQKNIQAIYQNAQPFASENVAQSWIYQLTDHIDESAAETRHELMTSNVLEQSSGFFTQLVHSVLDSIETELTPFYVSDSYDDKSLDRSKLLERAQFLLQSLPLEEPRSATHLLVKMFEMTKGNSLLDKLIPFHNNAAFGDFKPFNDGFIVKMVDSVLLNYERRYLDNTLALGRTLTRALQLIDLMSEGEGAVQKERLMVEIFQKEEFDLMALFTFDKDTGNSDITKFFVAQLLLGDSSIEKLTFGLADDQLTQVWMSLINLDESLAQQYFERLITVLPETDTRLSTFLVAYGNHSTVSSFFTSHFFDVWIKQFDSISAIEHRSAHSSVGDDLTFIERQTDIERQTEKLTTLFKWMPLFEEGHFRKSGCDEHVDAFVSGVTDKVSNFEDAEPIAFSQALKRMHCEQIEPELSLKKAPSQEIFSVENYLDVENSILEGKDILEAMSVWRTGEGLDASNSLTVEKLNYIKELFLNTYLLFQTQSQVHTGYSSSTIHKFSIVSPGKNYESQYILLKFLSGTELDYEALSTLILTEQTDPILKNLQLHIKNTDIAALLSECLELRSHRYLSDSDKERLTEKKEAVIKALKDLAGKPKLYETAHEILLKSPQFFMTPKAYAAKETLFQLLLSSTSAADYKKDYELLFRSLPDSLDRKILIADLIKNLGNEDAVSVITEALKASLSVDSSESINMYLDYLETLVKVLYPVSEKSPSIKTALAGLYLALPKETPVPNGVFVSTKFNTEVVRRLRSDWASPIFQDFIGCDSEILFDYMSVQTRLQSSKFVNHYQPKLKDRFRYNDIDIEVLRGRSASELSAVTDQKDWVSEMLAFIQTQAPDRQDVYLSALPVVFSDTFSVTFQQYSVALNDAAMTHTLKTQANDIYQALPILDILSYQLIFHKTSLGESDVNHIKDHYLKTNVLALREPRIITRRIERSLSTSEWLWSFLGYEPEFDVVEETTPSYNKQINDYLYAIVSANPDKNVFDLLYAFERVLKAEHADNGGLQDIIEGQCKRFKAKMDMYLEKIFTEIIGFYQFSAENEEERDRRVVEKLVEFIATVSNERDQAVLVNMFFENTSMASLKKEMGHEYVQDCFRPDFRSLFKDRLSEISSRNTIDPSQLIKLLDAKAIASQIVKLEQLHSFSENKKVMNWLLYALVQTPDKLLEVLHYLPLKRNKDILSALAEQVSLAAVDQKPEKQFPAEKLKKLVEIIFNKDGLSGKLRVFYTHLSVRLSNDVFNELFTSLSNTAQNQPLLDALIMVRIKLYSRRFSLEAKQDPIVLALAGEAERAEKAEELLIQKLLEFVRGRYINKPGMGYVGKAVVLSQLKESVFNAVWATIAAEEKNGLIAYLSSESLDYLTRSNPSSLSDYIETCIQRNEYKRVVILLNGLSASQKTAILNTFLLASPMKTAPLRAVFLELKRNQPKDFFLDIMNSFLKLDSTKTSLFFQDWFKVDSYDEFLNSFLRSASTDMCYQLLRSLTEITPSSTRQFISSPTSMKWFESIFQRQILSPKKVADLYLKLVTSNARNLGIQFAQFIKASQILDVCKELFSLGESKLEIALLNHFNLEQKGAFLDKLYVTRNSDFLALKMFLQERSGLFPVQLRSHDLFS